MTESTQKTPGLCMEFNTSNILVDPHPDELEEDNYCAMCRLVAVTPHVLDCGHYVCMKCLPKCLDLTHCPLADCEESELLEPPRRLGRRLIKRDKGLHVEIYCPYSPQGDDADGCKEITTVINLHEHLLECQHARVICPDCNHPIIRRDFAEHLRSECDCRLQTCAKCKDRVRQKDMNQHCAQKHKFCSFCQTNFDKGDPIHSMTNCQVCNDPLPSCQMAEHFTNCRGDRPHSDALNAALHTIAREVTLKQVEARLVEAEKAMPHPLQRFARHGPSLVTRVGRVLHKQVTKLEELAVLEASVDSGVHRWVLNFHCASNHCRLGVLPAALLKTARLVAKHIDLPLMQLAATGTLEVILDVDSHVMGVVIDGQLSCCPLPPPPHSLAVVLCLPNDVCSIEKYAKLKGKKAAAASKKLQRWLQEEGPASGSRFHLPSDTNAKLSKDGRRFSHKGDDWVCATAESRGLSWGVHHWKVRALGMDGGAVSVAVGLACPELVSDAQGKCLGAFPDSFGLDHAGECRQDGAPLEKRWTLGHGDYVEMELDLYSRTCNLTRNGFGASQFTLPALPVPPCTLAVAASDGQLVIEEYHLVGGEMPPLAAASAAPTFNTLAPALGDSGDGSVVAKLLGTAEEEALLPHVECGVHSFTLRVFTPNCRLGFTADTLLAAPSLKERVPSLPMLAGTVTVHVDPANKKLHVFMRDLLISSSYTPTAQLAVILTRPGDVCQLVSRQQLTPEAATEQRAKVGDKCIDIPMDRIGVTADGNATCIYCAEAIELSTYIAHVDKQCPERPVCCPHQRCEWSGVARQLEEHVGECPHADVTCPGCGEHMPRGELPEHKQGCFQDCEICHKRIAVRDIEEHVVECEREHHSLTHFHPTHHGGYQHIMEDGKAVQGDYDWSTAVITHPGVASGVATWKVKLVSGLHCVVIGVHPPGPHAWDDYIGSSGLKGIGWHGCCSQIYFHPNQIKYSVPRFTAGAVITIRLDMDRHQVTFSTDGVPEFTRPLPTQEPHVLAVSTYDNAVVRILSVEV